MYCKKCGKEILDGAGFCKFCGGRVKTDTPAPTESRAFAQISFAPLPAVGQKETQPKKLPVSMSSLGLALAALVIVVIAAGLIFAGVGNKSKREIRQAKKYLEEGNYEEAWGCCERVLEKDRRYVEAYLVCADIHIGREPYNDAIEILDEYLETANEKELKKYKENFDEKREEIYHARVEVYLTRADERMAMDAYSDALAEVNKYMRAAGTEEIEEYGEMFDEKREEIYRAQGEALAGVWQLNYDICNLIPKGSTGSYTTPMDTVPILLEFDGAGGLYLSIEQDYFDGMRQILSDFATAAATAVTRSSLGGKAAGWVTDLVTGLLADNAGVSYSYDVAEDRLYCTNAEGEEESYLFEINGATLTFQSCSEEKYYLDFPLELKRAE